MSNVALDNRIYILQKTVLPKDLSQLLYEADKCFLQDRDSESEAIISQIEAICKENGITLYSPSFQNLF